jgi:hypothetical protein
MNFFEDLAIHRAFLGDNGARRACPDDEYVVQQPLLELNRRLSRHEKSASRLRWGPEIGQAGAYFNTLERPRQTRRPFTLAPPPLSQYSKTLFCGATPQKVNA